MHNDSTKQPDGRRPAWRVLLLDRSDPADPLWVLCTVAEPGDVRPAGAGDTPDDVTLAWAAGQGTLTPLPRVLAWRIDR
jgi:hypothetical protein